MFGLVSPGDIMKAVTSARTAEARQRDLSALSKSSASLSVEDLLTSDAADYLRPERAIFAAMDANRDEDEERRAGRKTTSAFDQIIAAQVAAAVGTVYEGDNAARLDVLAKDPFAPASAVSNLKPRISAEAMKVAKENGFPVESIFGNSLDKAMIALQGTAADPATSSNASITAALMQREGLARIARGLYN